MFRIHAVGLKALATQFAALPKAMNVQLGKRMRDYAKDPIMEDSLQMCPKDTGALRSTNSVRRTKTNPNVIQIRLSYGGRTPGSSKHFEQGAKIKPVVEYAHRLHEHTYKNYSEPGTGPKYLEIPILNHKIPMERIIRSGVQEAVVSVFSSTAFGHKGRVSAFGKTPTVGTGTGGTLATFGR